MTNPSILQTSSGSRRTAKDRREQIIAASRTLFAQNGFDATSMAQIARESQVLVGQIYRDFAGKEDIIAALVERDVSELLDDPELIGATATRRADQLYRWLHQFIGRRLDEDRRRVLSEIISEGTRNPRIAAIITQAHERLRERIATAALIWVPHANRDAERERIAELILTLAGAIKHRQIFGLEVNLAVAAKLVAVVEAEIRSCS